MSLAAQIASLKTELHRADEADLHLTSGSQISEIAAKGAKVKVGVHGATAESGASQKVNEKQTQEIEERFKRSKIDFLHRHIIEYQSLFREISQFSGGDAFLFIDDLYHIKRADQPKLVDYFHRIAKNNGPWLKIGTIRHRTWWYVHDDPPTGLKIGDDADEIDLDLTLEKYILTKKFLKKILLNFATAAKMGSLDHFLTPGAIDRLVLASGGVARDFLSIFRRSVDIARERGGGPRGERVGAEDINRAAGENDSSKRQEFKLDTSDDSGILEKEFEKLRDYCLNIKNTNCLLLDKELAGVEVDLIQQLVDLKLIHLASSRVTLGGRRGKIYEAYMLDLSQYAGERKRRGLDIVEFWKPSSKGALRKKSLVYRPSEE